MQEIKQKESLGDELCEYCHADANVTAFSTGCEGRFCDIAYDNYIDSIKYDEDKSCKK